MTEQDLESELKEATRAAWRRYQQLLDPIRPDLFRYCRKLTGNVWDAEDLIQDALEQGFGKLGSVHRGIDNPRGYLLRIASNLWLTRVRREQAAARALQAQASRSESDAAASPEGAAEVRDAGAALLQQLAPQERAAVLLKEVFDMSLDEIAHVLGTTVGAVKAALHRGRERLGEAESAGAPRHPVSREVIDRFVERYNARDLPGLLALMLDTASIEMPGVAIEIGRADFSKRPGWFHWNLFRVDGGGPATALWETALFEGEPIVLVRPFPEQPGIGSVMRMQTLDGRIARIRSYSFCPDTIREVAAALGENAVPWGVYRFPETIVLPKTV
jgi:RNA polymerase sigma-70 factor (ECF subfamily)